MIEFVILIDPTLQDETDLPNDRFRHIHELSDEELKFVRAKLAEEYGKRTGVVA